MAQVSDNCVCLIPMCLIWREESWNVGTGPIISYDREGEQWGIPRQINTGNTVLFDGRSWKPSLGLDYYVKKSNALGSEWMISFKVTPVVKPGLGSLFGLSEK